jgi:glyceraldehyde 3-phosphate dehydrogenase
MTTVHCYTGSQPTVDKPRQVPERSRAAALSMVPTTTSAQHQTGLVLPGLQGPDRGARDPGAHRLGLRHRPHRADPDPAERGQVDALFREAAARSPVFGYTDKPLVSSDLRSRPESIILSGPEISVSTGGLLRVFGWYDNEWGFSCRMIDMARLIASRRT